MRPKLCMLQICLLSLFVLVLFKHNSIAQEYPLWFLNQADVPYGKTAVGYANPSFYPDSSVSYAILNGCETYAKQMWIKLFGGQAFWSTELGTFWMGSDFSEQFDSSAIAIAKTQLKPLDTLFAKNMVLVLLGNSTSSANYSINRKISVKNLSPPEWTESPPKDSEYYYAVGVTPEYYYEKSSWIEAENLARRNLAKTIIIEVKAIQRLSTQFQEFRYEELQVELNNVQTVARWRDVKNRLFFVLIRMGKGGR